LTSCANNEIELLGNFQRSSFLLFVFTFYDEKMNENLKEFLSDDSDDVFFVENKVDIFGIFLMKDS